MIKFIPVEEILEVRNQVLREGKLKPDECRFPSDLNEGAFHLGNFGENQLLSIASFHPQNIEPYTGKGYQLRGMATVPGFQGKGYGNQILNFAIVYLRRQKVNYLWCNARKKALNFYAGIGFEIISDEFDVPGIGPHHVMYLKIQ
ncbi:GNAT family N-acetyltransferase [Mucilaginibacter arboris]|uniref:GNAT family N-acetyltransferase n=1 Tax=Mucilaginibacter arboris TaxID=2682090 RepID=A0A7K1STK5_9SPHI|nr:GNAT family N-acetyltransferase [Mucilaginibacter arboris]MVN20636.1 GNAT family N-acetyltransferase [Mucilaginibacter arboris]